ncbi:hypothetical protein WMY93_027477 [Mugilogobius chulae]|uniref:Peptidase M12B propeptide domain-containing protein n=1 Tax=Mugilogobius chulae TaxID=88201 RepID=A0AAW0MZT0_9GOBI
MQDKHGGESLTHLSAPPQHPSSHYEVVYPSRVDAKGHFLSHFLSHHAPRMHRRAAPEEEEEGALMGGHSLRFNLSLNPHLLAPGVLSERRYGSLSGAKLQPPSAARCHYLGEVWEDGTVRGRAALSTCNGLLDDVMSDHHEEVVWSNRRMNETEYYRPLHKYDAR